MSKDTTTTEAPTYFCPDCRGKGTYPGLDITCRTCHGTGERPSTPAEPLDTGRMTYETPVRQYTETICCAGDPAAVHFNAHNQCVQCHNCGHVYEPLRLVPFVVEGEAMIDIEREADVLVARHVRKSNIPIPKHEILRDVIALCHRIRDEERARIKQGTQQLFISFERGNKDPEDGAMIWVKDLMKLIDAEGE